ncbi:MAG TPA: DUF5666 domain-containing protein [Edaphobacter sp.]|nr:DUF5666 domain-containing protein [Edaphobacter sp.]
MRTRWAGPILACMMGMIGAGAAGAQDAPDGGAALARGPMVRGTVTALAADHLTIKTDAGEAYDVALSPNTRLMKDRQPVKLAEIKVGDGVGAMGELDAPKKTLHALLVAVVDAEQVKKFREDLGKAYITGKVTAMEDVKLTVLRPDHVSQVIEVDETTSFRKGRRRGATASDGSAANAASANGSGEMVTLADVKVGDMIAGQGSVKHGIFVPTNLSILPPGAAGAMGMQGRHGDGGATSDSTAAASSSKQ